MDTAHSDSIPSVGISVSGGEDARALGFSDHIINRMTIRLAEFFLFKGWRVVFGHDWREDGVMRAVAGLAEEAASGGKLSDLGPVTDRMFNLVPTAGAAVSPLAAEAAAGSGEILKVRSLAAHLGEHGRWDGGAGLDKERCAELWVLRDELTRLLDPGIRICVGGTKEGYSGYYAGIAEEAYFALKHRKPLYLIGGLGGVSKQVADALRGDGANPPSLMPPAERPAPFERSASVAKELEFPLDGLAGAFRDFEIGRLVECNGLSEDENIELFDTSDLESALDLIWKGCRKVVGA